MRISSVACVLLAIVLLVGIALASYYFYWNFEIKLRSNNLPSERCILMVDFPEKGDIMVMDFDLASDNPNSGISELYDNLAFYGNSIDQTPLEVFSHHEPKYSEDQLQCLAEYEKFLKYVYMKTSVPFLTVKCPSKACRHFGTRTFLALDSERVHLETLADELNYETYKYNIFKVEKEQKKQVEESAEKEATEQEPYEDEIMEEGSAEGEPTEEELFAEYPIVEEYPQYFEESEEYSEEYIIT